MGMPAPDSVKRLVDLFDRERKVYQLPDYKEEQLRAESGPRRSIRHSYFVIRNYPGMPVIHEESIKVAGATKAPDYTFGIGGRRDLDQPAARGYIDSRNVR